VYWKILRNELKLRGTWNSMYGSTVNDWKDALVQIADPSFPVERLITHRFSLSDHEKAFIKHNAKWPGWPTVTNPKTPYTTLPQ
jgi:threonine dehydrogenase-like Zn-dependent dehydrogenase